jgi:hypothetical protein
MLAKRIRPLPGSARSAMEGDSNARASWRPTSAAWRGGHACSWFLFPGEPRVAGRRPHAALRCRGRVAVAAAPRTWSGRFADRACAPGRSAFRVDRCSRLRKKVGPREATNGDTQTTWHLAVGGRAVRRRRDRAGSGRYAAFPAETEGKARLDAPRRDARAARPLLLPPSQPARGAVVDDAPQDAQAVA